MVITRVKTMSVAVGLSFCILASSLAVTTASYGQSTRDRINSLNARLDWIEQALIELQSSNAASVESNVSGQPLQMFDGEAAEQGEDPAVATALSRIDDLEQQIRDLTNQLEQVTFKIDQANRELESLSEDADYRLRALETGTTPDGAPPARPALPVQTAEEQVLGTIPADQAPGGYQEDYDGALSHLRRGEHDNAEQALRLFLDNHGDSDLAGNAQYWLGESYYVREMWRPAAQSFLICVQKYKDGLKAPDCMLKLGMSLAAMGEKDKACKTLSEVPRRFPDASQTIMQRARAERQRNGCS